MASTHHGVQIMHNPPRSKLATNLRMTVTSKVVGSTLVALTCNLPTLSMRSDDTAQRILLVFMMQLHIPCSRWQQPVLCWLHASGLGNSCSLSSPAQCHQQHVGCGWKVRRHSANRHQYSFRNDVWVQAHISNTTAHPDTMLDVSGSLRRCCCDSGCGAMPQARTVRSKTHMACLFITQSTSTPLSRS